MLKYYFETWALSRVVHRLKYISALIYHPIFTKSVSFFNLDSTWKMSVLLPYNKNSVKTDFILLYAPRILGIYEI